MFAGFGFQFFDAFFGGGKIFRHGAAEAFDRFSDGFTDLIVRGICFLRGVRSFAAHLGFGLSDAEEVSGEFFAAHKIEDLFTVFQPLVFSNVLCGHAAIEAAIARILEGGIFQRGDDTCFFCGFGKQHILLPDVTADEQAFFIFGEAFIKFGELLLPCFDGEICLPPSDDVLAGIPVHYDEIAGIAGEFVIDLVALCSAADGNHFPDFGKMVVNTLLADLAGNLRGLYDLMKIFPFGVLQCSLQFTGKPVFVAVFIDVPKVIKQLFLGGLKLIHKIIIAQEPKKGNPCPIQKTERRRT